MYNSVPQLAGWKVIAKEIIAAVNLAEKKDAL